ncbi:RNA-binding protein ARP1 [Spatholobus suberectus]|nr:RNA-binding protein ARP1 [Spatholobus suberectus]
MMSTTTTTTTNNNNNNVGEFGDTTLTKVFVGGLAWETPKDALRDHFEKYGEILEAVIISDKLTGKSKGYGFVTFKEAEAAKKACEDSAAAIINGRRANCNLAFLGARRPRSSSAASPPPQPQGGSNGGVLKNNASSTPPTHVQPYYHPVGTPILPFHHHTLPFYGYAPTYIVTDINYNYNQKQCYGSGGTYMNGHHLSHVYPRQAIVGANTLMPIYPLYQYHHPTETIGVPAHNFYQTAPWHLGPAPTGVMSKPSSIIPHAGTVGTGDCFKRVV